MAASDRNPAYAGLKEGIYLQLGNQDTYLQEWLDPGLSHWYQASSFYLSERLSPCGHQPPKAYVGLAEREFFKPRTADRTSQGGLVGQESLILEPIGEKGVFRLTNVGSVRTPHGGGGEVSHVPLSPGRRGKDAILAKSGVHLGNGTRVSPPRIPQTQKDFL